MPEGQQRLLRLLVDTVVMRDTAVEIHGILPAFVEAAPSARNRPGSPDSRPNYDPAAFLLVVATDR